mgnify:CR=1 FL=1
MVESLYDRIKDKISLTPLAGSDGFYRMVRWIQQDERASNLHLLRSGDLVISTEHTDVSTDELLDYIRSLNDMNASGLILYAHVTDSEDHMIAPEVEELCRELQFPLLCVPESIHIGDITREACSALFDFDHAYDTVNDILSGLLYDPHMSSRNEEYIVSDSLSMRIMSFSLFAMTKRYSFSRQMTIIINISIAFSIRWEKNSFISEKRDMASYYFRTYRMEELMHMRKKS